MNSPVNNYGRQIRTTGLAAAAFISFFIFGFSDVLKGSAIPEIIAATSIGYGAGGALIGFTYFGFFAGTLGSVVLLKKYPAPKLLIWAAAAACAGLWLFSIAEIPTLMFASAFLIGTGGGLIDVAANLTIRMTTESSRIGRRLNQLAFFHGIGAIVSPLFAGLVLAHAADWHRIYLFAGIVTIVLFGAVTFLVTRSRYPAAEADNTAVAPRLRPSVALLGGILFFYMTLEAGISGWLVEYGRNVAGVGEKQALFFLSLFFILLTIGRFISSFYVDRIGLLKTIVLNFIVILVFTGAAVVVDGLFILIPCAGLFMAPLFPTTVAMISNELANSNIRIMGLFFSVAGVGGIFGPWMIGMTAKSFSLQTGFALMMVFSLCAITVCTLYKIVSGRR